jgi:predicted nuclease of restriction endonuclease-like RecB superfamily
MGQSGHINRGNKNARWLTFGEGKRYYLRSKYELKYAYYVEYLKRNGQIKEWFYEPDEFWFESIKRGVRSYKPDFKLIYNDGREVYVEAKGYWDSKSLTKIKRFKKYYPKLKILTVDTSFFSKHNEFLNHLLKTMSGIVYDS